MCEGYPGHNKIDKIYAKVWIIGRAYASGIERHTKLDNNETAMEKICTHLYENKKEISDIFKTLSNVKEPLNSSKLQMIVEMHGQFNSLLTNVTRNSNNVRSFASKYLHFHCPAVPIYDSRVSSVIRRRDWYPWGKYLNTFPKPDNADDEYWKFVVRFWNLYQDLEAEGKEVNVRRLDNYLLWWA